MLPFARFIAENYSHHPAFCIWFWFVPSGDSCSHVTVMIWGGTTANKRKTRHAVAAAPQQHVNTLTRRRFGFHAWVYGWAACGRLCGSAYCESRRHGGVVPPAFTADGAVDAPYIIDSFGCGQRY